jgi:hypothetical protein
MLGSAGALAIVNFDFLPSGRKKLFPQPDVGLFGEGAEKCKPRKTEISTPCKFLCISNFVKASSSNSLISLNNLE